MAEALFHGLLKTAIAPAMALLPSALDTPLARRHLLAISLQEADGTARFQRLNGGGKGPARGLWQMEEGGGVKGVLTHPASRELALKVCAARGVLATNAAAWQRMEFDDVLAAAFARLLLLTDPKALPTEEHPAWELYRYRLWRPGKPHPEKWPSCWARAGAALGLS
jgi:hypothetical protein